MCTSRIYFLVSKFQLVRDFRSDVLECDGRSGYPLKAHAVEREARQLAHLHLPLHEVVAGGVAGHAQQHVALSQLVLAAVGVQHLPNLLHHLAGLHGRGGLHAPRETERARLRLVFEHGEGCGRRGPAPWGGGGVLVVVLRPHAGLLRLLCTAEHGSGGRDGQRGMVVEEVEMSVGSEQKSNETREQRM